MLNDIFKAPSLVVDYKLTQQSQTRFNRIVVEPEVRYLHTDFGKVQVAHINHKKANCTCCQIKGRA